ncbi:MAG: S8 family peptidase [Firmicutes bacterium]|nr:S8 family peptidase [Bacillota bacterium]
MSIDNLGNIGFQPNVNLTPGKFAPKPPVEAEPSIAQDSFTSSAAKSQQYVILPPKQLAIEAQKGGIFRSEENQLSKFDVTVQEKLPLIGGYVANIDDSTKKKLTEAGYYVFVDEEKSWLPSKPWEKNIVDATVGTSETGEKTEDLSLKDRPVMTQPRFDTPLTRQYQGEGVTIAVIDTGIYPHPDLISPENRIVAFVDFVNGKKIPYDDNGHGTHVAGDAAGSGMMSDGLYKAPAPKAKLIGLKALAGQGGGKTSDIIKAIEWCIKNKEKFNIRVINMSLGHTASEDYQNDPTDQAVKKAYEAGIVVVAAAGNEGPGPSTVGAPGDSPHAISVGAADDMNTPDPKDDKIANFSSRGPTPGGLMKPDLVAPGVAIISTLSPGTGAETTSERMTNLKETMKWFSQMPDEALVRVPDESLRLLGLADSTIEKWKSDPKLARKEIKRLFNATLSLPLVDKTYTGMPGTSMASPFVAGVVAQMLSANPNLKPYEVADILKSTADKIDGYKPEDQGQGMVDPNEAIEKALLVKEGKLQITEPVLPWGPIKAGGDAKPEEKKA